MNFVEQIKGNVFNNATKQNETIVHERFRQKLSSSGVRRDRQQKKKEAKKRKHSNKHTCFCFLYLFVEPMITMNE